VKGDVERTYIRCRFERIGCRLVRVGSHLGRANGAGQSRYSRAYDCNSLSTRHELSDSPDRLSQVFVSSTQVLKTDRLTRRRAIRQDDDIHKLCLFPGGHLFTTSLELLDVFQLVHVGIENPLEGGAGSGERVKIDIVRAGSGTYGVPLVGLTLLKSFSTLFAVCRMSKNQLQPQETTEHSFSRNDITQSRQPGATLSGKISVAQSTPSRRTLVHSGDRSFAAAIAAPGHTPAGQKR
jgi:hypothetical protein